MISETISLLKTALKNPTYGVNVFLNSGSLPTIADVYAETTDYWMTVGGTPNTFPVLMV